MALYLGYYDIGSFAGWLNSNCAIVDCYSYASINHTRTSYTPASGGFLGCTYNTPISSSYFAGSLLSNMSECGTFAGRYESNPTINNCYYDSNSSKIKSNHTLQGTAFTNFGSMTALPTGFSSDTWIIKDGKPELRIFLTPEEIAQLGG